MSEERGIVWKVLADAFCANGFCGGNQTSAPCEKAQQMADVAIKALDSEISARALNRLWTGDYTTCDGYCQADY